MSKCYFELRKNTKQIHLNLAADIMRHLHARQYLGKTVIVCEHPAIFLATTHKQWLKLSRTIQQRRAGTADADKILKYTHTITHMQHMHFTTKQPLEDPEATVYFMRPDQIDDMPNQCLTVYMTTPLPKDIVLNLIRQLPAETLFVDYAAQAPLWEKIAITPKKQLEEQLASKWSALQAFLAKQHIDVKQLFKGPIHNVEIMDDALDTLLIHGHSFLQVADDFRHALELARPLRLSKNLREEYDIVTILAHRVQALSSNSFTQRFLETYNEDDTFFLYDSARKQLQRNALVGESLTAAITRHVHAGRHHLAHALRKHATAH